MRPSSGEIVVGGHRLSAFSGPRLDRFRGREMGIVLQRLCLLPALSVLENLLLAQRFAGVDEDPPAARTLLERLGLNGLAAWRPSRLSHGQAQRVAIARALVHRPRLVLADEPTSSLDDDDAQRVLDLLREQSRLCGAALLIVTHDRRIAGQLDTELRLEGRA